MIAEVCFVATLLAMTLLLTLILLFHYQHSHCEERSDEAIRIYLPEV